MLTLHPLRPALVIPLALATVLSSTACDVLWPSICTLTPDHPGCNATFRVTPSKVSLTGSTTVQVVIDQQDDSPLPEQVSLTLQQADRTYTAKSGSRGPSSMTFIIANLQMNGFGPGSCQFNLSINSQIFISDCSITPAGQDARAHLSISSKSRSTYQITQQPNILSTIIGVLQRNEKVTLLAVSNCPTNNTPCDITTHEYDHQNSTTNPLSAKAKHKFAVPQSDHFAFTSTRDGIIQLNKNTPAQYWNIETGSSSTIVNSNVSASVRSYAGSVTSNLAAKIVDDQATLMNQTDAYSFNILTSSKINCAVSLPTTPSTTTSGKQDIYILSDCANQSVIRKAVCDTNGQNSSVAPESFTTRQRPTASSNQKIAVLGRKEAHHPIHIIMSVPNSLFTISCEPNLKNCIEYDPFPDIDTTDLLSISTADMNGDKIDDVALIFKNRIEIYNSIFVD